MLNFILLSLQTFPCHLLVPLFALQKATVKSTKGNGSNWALWCQAVDCFETIQKERIQDPYMFALYLQPLSMRPNCVIPLIPHWGRHSSWGTSLLCSLLCQEEIKAIFLFPQKTFISTNKVPIFLFLPALSQNSQLVHLLKRRKLSYQCRL